MHTQRLHHFLYAYMNIQSAYIYIYLYISIYPYIYVYKLSDMLSAD